MSGKNVFVPATTPENEAPKPEFKKLETAGADFDRS